MADRAGMRALKFVVNRLMALWLVVCAVVGYVVPGPFLPLGPWTLWMLAAVIFFMGLTLKWEEIGGVFRAPRALATGMIVKWISVPLVAYAAAVIAFRDQPQLAGGVILDGSTPSGVSANVFTFLSGGSVALSIAMSAMNTLLSPVLTPLATSRLAGTFVHVNARAMFVQMLQVVLAPVLLGLAIRASFRTTVERLQPVLPMLSALALYLIVLALVSASARSIQSQANVLPRILAITTTQILVTLAIGYLAGLPLGFDRRDRIAIMFEVGIYNSGLGAALAAANFGAFAALPAIANAMANLVIGALLTAYLAQRAERMPVPVPGEGV
ncbi:MAG: bile acid:sodium symporter family protein [Betaproteobacteria bacterium]